MADLLYRLSPRVEPVVVSTAKKNAPAPIPRRHYNLPFSQPRWKKITETFKLHSAILPATRNNRCQSTFLKCEHEGVGLELRTAVSTSFDRAGSFSLSCTHFSASKLNLAVVYSCDSNQVQRVTQLLRTYPEVASHPLLMVGVFVELQLNQMQNLVREVHSVGDINNRHFKSAKPMPRSLPELDDFLGKGFLGAREIEEELQATKTHLNEMAGRIEEQTKSSSVHRPIENTDRFMYRFRDINVELEGMAAQCRVVAEQQRYRGELVSARPRVSIWVLANRWQTIISSW